MKNPFLWLRSPVYLCYFGKQAVLLNLKQDDYSLLSINQSKILDEVLTGKIQKCGKDFFQNNKILSHEASEIIKQFQAQRILSSRTHKVPYPFYVHRQQNIEGMPNIDWRLPLDQDQEPFSFNKDVFSALLTLIKLRFSMKFLGFNYTMKRFKKLKKKSKSYLPPTERELNKLLNALNFACLIFPFQTLCLQWSMSLTSLLLKKGYKCNLIIGVQNFPFLAHAWVEANGQVVADSKDLPNKLAIILEEPFRKESVS